MVRTRKLKRDIPTKPSRSWQRSLLVLTILLSSVGLITGGVWLSVLLIFNPNALVGINDVLPKWAKIPQINQEKPQTLTQIQANIRKAGQIPGEVLVLETNSQTLQPTSILLPVISSQPNCQTDCQQIIELRAYKVISTQNSPWLQKSDVYYQLVDQVDVVGPEEAFAIAPILNSDIANSGSSRPLPLTQVQRFEGNTPTSGIWLDMWGQRQQAGNAIAYGQIVHYNPKYSSISLMLPWTSPTGQAPQWQQVTGSPTPELVVDQTIELEPQLRVYQLQPTQFFRKPFELELISLAEPALNSPDYEKALLLARTGLWSPAWKWLQFIKRQRQQHHKSWSTAAQAQVDVIRLYAQRTKTQADTTWANPSQEVLTDLIDGRWQEALQVFEASPENTQEIALLLEGDSERLWNRVQVSLRIDPNHPEIQAWGALIVAGGQGTDAARLWLKIQPKIAPQTVAYIQTLLKRLDGDFSKPKSSSGHSSRIVGSVEPITQINPQQWLQPNQKATLKLEKGQAWYQVQLAAYHDGEDWQYIPFSNLQPSKPTAAKSLWKELGLDSSAEIEIITWLTDGQQQSTIATVKAVQLQNGVLRLLAAAEKIPHLNSNNWQRRPLALTPTAIEWVEPNPITLAELSQQQPLQVKKILPILWREWQKINPSSTKSAIPSVEQMQQQLGQWPVQLIDLTGNGEPEVVLSVLAAAITNSKTVTGTSKPHTIIFSDSGDLVYNDCAERSAKGDCTFRALTQLEDNQPPALLIEGTKTYSLQRWSSGRQRFE